ncbi:MlaD family protein [Mycobacteroides abscessus subsp. abscessus]|uniref:MlaD family protein n=1 Tax=Mycobacteroides abscessus TaxID=36809 RepID=UPI00266B7D6F|nr:MlaD family protein [Mycobacteroides abscessus]MDO3308475.1 MlaD family protein [Mycobacteroides abscessus subsp. abscessus]
MRFRGPLIGLTVFMTVALTLGWLVYATLLREVSGSTTAYSAIFTDVYGLREGDDVRMAGVRVGRVQKIELVDNERARVDFVVQNDQKLYGNTIASVTYQNIVGQRYVGLSPGKSGGPAGDTVLAAGATIPVERTDPSFDVTTLLNGYEPLFSTLSPEQADNLTKGVIQSLQGLPDVVPRAMENIQSLSSVIADRRDQLGTLLKSTEKVTSTLRRQQSGIGVLINQGQDILEEIVTRRNTFHAMLQSFTNLVEQLSKVVVQDRAQLNAMLKTAHELSDMLGKHDDLLRSLYPIAPVLIRGIANSTGTGNAIDINLTNGLLVDSWMCAISGRAKQFGMIPYFKDCK